MKSPDPRAFASGRGAPPAPPVTPAELDALPDRRRRLVAVLLSTLAQTVCPAAAERLRGEIREAVETAPARRRTAPAPRYTTDAARDWARAQGWRVMAREPFDFRTRRHKDLAGGSDVCAIDGDGYRVWIQGAGAGERPAHRRRFEARKGQLARGERFVYVEFQRGGSAPLLVEWWA